MSKYTDEYEVWVKIKIHEIHKMNEMHVSKHRNPQHLSLYDETMNN